MEVIRADLLRLELSDVSQVAEARRAVAALCGQHGLSEALRGQAALVVTEAAGNVIKHGGGGELLAQVVGDGGRGLEILSVDKGRGMADVARCMEDGFSTAGTPGTGLGAIRRQSRAFDLYSQPGQGTVLWAALGPLPTPGALAAAGLSVAKPGETACGDAWALARAGGRILAMVADGLGHGPQAAEAARAALGALEHAAANGPEAVIEEAHGRLRALRGAAVAVAELDPTAQSLSYVGVGNISGILATEGKRQALVSHNGTVGHELRKVQRFEYRAPPGSTLVMTSDGIATGFDLAKYPGILARPPAILAGALYRDFRRTRDDATVLVVRSGE